MPYISKEDVARAKEMDLLTYLKNYEPHEVVHVKGNVYQTKSHDSLKISNGKWMWWSEGIGGRSALDYLIKVEGMEFQDAVQQIIGNVEYKAPEPVQLYYEPKEKKVLIPEAYNPADKAYNYLVSRGIDEMMLIRLHDKKLWYETEKYHNVAFVGYDKDKNIKLVTLRSIDGDFKNTTSGSDRHFPFRLVAEENGKKNSVVHLFEAPIDALSYATLMKQMGYDYREHNYLALCGVYQPKENIEESAVPIGLTQYLKDYPYTKTVCLHLDNDAPGKKAAKALQLVVGKLGLEVINQPPPEGYKDCNDFLLKGSAYAAVKDKARDNEKEGR